MIVDKAQLSILILWDDAGQTASTVRTHVQELMRHSRHAVRSLSMMGNIPEHLNLDSFDVIVIHYSIVMADERYLSPAAKQKLRASRATKVAFIQDEYRFVDQTINAVRDINIRVLFTCVPEGEIEKVYPQAKLPDVQKVNVLTGYVDLALISRSTPAYRERPIDIGYRARKVPPWLGELGQEKWNIGRRVKEDAGAFRLVVDLAYREEERLYGEKWINFLSNCKATLGVESGASVFDFSGDIQRKVECALEKNPCMRFEELQERYFLEAEGKIRLNQISPRCFEAAALRTLMILYEGEYSKRMIPWKHYVPLRKDHANFQEVVDVLKDPVKAGIIIDRAYHEVALNPDNSYMAFANIFDNAISSYLGSRYSPVDNVYSDELFDSVVLLEKRVNQRSRFTRRVWTWTYFFIFGKVLSVLSERSRDRIQVALTRRLRPVYRWLFKR